jgi:hypothetical protein
MSILHLDGGNGYLLLTGKRTRQPALSLLPEGEPGPGPRRWSQWPAPSAPDLRTAVEYLPARPCPAICRGPAASDGGGVVSFWHPDSSRGQFHWLRLVPLGTASFLSGPNASPQLPIIRGPLAYRRHLVEVRAAVNRSFGRITPFKERFPVNLPERCLATLSGENPAHSMADS